MAGLWSRIKVWSAGEVLKASELNAEFDNIKNNDIPSQSDDYSLNVTQMQLQTSPGALGSESLATSLAGEIERIRYSIAQMKGSTYWYEVIPSSLSGSKPYELSMYLPFDAEESSASNATEVYRDFIRRGGVINAASWSVADVVSGDFGTTNKKFGSHSYSLGSGNILAHQGQYVDKNRSSLSCHFRNLSANDYLAFNPLLGIELYLDGSGFLTAKQTLQGAATESTKTVKTVAGAASRAGSTSFAHAVMKWANNGVNGASTDQLSLIYNGSNEGSQISSDSFVVNGGDGGFWFFGSKRNDPSWTKFSAFSVLPNSEASGPWTLTSAGSPSAAVSGGVLSLTTASATDTNYYSKTFTGSATNFTMEAKLRVTSSTVNTTATTVNFGLIDNVAGRQVYVGLTSNGLQIRQAATDLSGLNFKINMNCADWHVYRLTLSGSPSPTAKLFVDGVLVWSGIVSNATAPASKTVYFGHINAGAGASSEWEYVKYIDTSATAPIAASNSGELDDVAIMTGAINASVITSLSTNKASQVFNSNPKYGMYVPTHSFQGNFGYASSTVTGTTWTELTNSIMYCAGDDQSGIDYTAHTLAIHTDPNTGYVGTCMNDLLNVGSSIAGTDGESIVGAVVTTISTTVPRQYCTHVLRSVPKLGLNKFSQYVVNSTGGNATSTSQDYMSLARSKNGSF